MRNINVNVQKLEFLKNAQRLILIVEIFVKMTKKQNFVWEVSMIFETIKF